MESRKKYLKNLGRIVVKIGSSSLTTLQGRIDMENMRKFCLQITGLRGKRHPGHRGNQRSYRRRAAAAEYRRQAPKDGPAPGGSGGGAGRADEDIP